jgi:RHS repeat-associated protein
VRAGTTTVYLGGLWEETVGGAVRKYYTLAGQTVALRTIDGATNTVEYIQGDHLGSVSVVTTYQGVATTQEFDPWGKVRTGGISQTKRNFTGQILDDTGLLFYNARYYDPAIGRFISADTVVPGSPSGSMDGVAVKSLTVSFHEAAFRGKLATENALGFWFQFTDDQRRQHGSPMGPAQPQALNRYSYVLNNPLRWTDPGGHTVYLSQEQARVFVDYLRQMARELTNRAEGRPDNVKGVIAAVAGAFSGLLGNVISKLFLNLEALKWKQIAKLWEIADTIATVNDASPDGVALAIGNDAGTATSGDYPSDLYVLNRTTGDVSPVHLGWLMSGIIFGFGLSEWNLGMAFGDALENGKYVFADDVDGRGLGPGNVCPPEAISC